MHVPMLTMLLGHHYYGRVGIYRSCNSILASQRVFLNTLSERLNVTVAAEGRMNVVPRAWWCSSLG